MKTLSALVLGASLLSTSPALALDEAAQAAAQTAAKALAGAAAARARQGELRVAIDLYEEAYGRAPRREYLREIGVLYDTLAIAGDARDVRLAIVYLERSLVDEGATPERAAVESRLARLRLWKSKMHPEPILPRPALVPVHMLAYKADDTYEVEIGPAKCVTPCTLLVPPGPMLLRAQGAGKIEQQMVVPTRPGQIRLQHYSSGSFTAGAVMVPVGLAVGASFWAFGLLCYNDSGCALTNIILWPVLGASTMITGIVLLALGRNAP